MNGHAARGHRSSRHALARPRLTQRIAGKDAAPITVLQGPPGLGKSVLLDQVGALSKRERLARIASHDELAAHNDRLSQDSQATPDLVLIDGIDGADETLDMAIRSSLDCGARVAVATRGPLATVTAAMVLDGTAHIVPPEELLFTSAEMKSLAHKYKVDISDEDTAELHRAADGWPALVDAVLRSRRQDAPLTDRRLREVVDRFVRDDVLAAMPGTELPMLMCAASIPRFDATVLALLLADLDADVDAVQAIDRWTACGWIIHDDLDGHWRIPQPMRQSLLADLDVKHPGRRAELTTKAVQMLVAAGRTTDALPYLAEASLDDVVARVLRDRWGDDVAAQGRFSDTHSVVASVTDEMLASDPSLLLISATSALRGPTDIDTFALRLSQANSVVDRDSLNGPLMTFHSLSMMLARMNGDIHRANALERSGQAYIDSATDEQRHEQVNRIAYFKHQIGTSRLAEGRLQEADATFRSARSMARNNRADWYVAVTESKLAYVSFLRGDLSACRQQIESTRLYADSRSDELLIQHVNLVLGFLELEHGRTWNVPGMLNHAYGMLHHDAEPPASRLAMAWAVLGLMSADPGAAEQALLLCGSDYATNKLPFNGFLAVIARAHARLVQGDPKAVLNELDDVAAPEGHAALLAITRERACLALNDPPAAARELAPYNEMDVPLPVTVRADWLALTAECALRQDLDARPAYSRLVAVLERTGARRPILLLPELREAVASGRLSEPPSSPLASLDVEVTALMK
ncbi:hypothetical protein, partial [Phytoactinopolyspora endophytica]|uniref:hypothetical protein n=1 Tax=Phytoactinopolyspora endophytica TaxID=1642495 RepID=UPI0013EBB940